jgi:non-specific serine/threonine protein kinase
MALEPDQQLLHYRLIEQIGEGGMGVVWKAEDTRLQRQVALKLLPAELTADVERLCRFEQEARAASALNHPNIVTVYDVGDTEAGRFIVMELVAGRTLRAVIAGEVSVETLLELGTQMAKALGAAHAAGIAHRDIKPDNVMVRDDGYVKVLDFGLARLRSATEGAADGATMTRHTALGTALGTVAYMSPEQARGETVGHPSDVFSLGVVLYELATGRHPFKADTPVGYLHAITSQTPPPPTQWRPELPSGLSASILRMLAKDADRRQTAEEIARTLQEIERHGDVPVPYVGEGDPSTSSAPQAAATRVEEGFRVAVLPFKWRGESAELEALAEGLSEEIVTGLSRFSYLRVISRSSPLRFTDEVGDVRAIGRELGARYVMEGSLRQGGSRLRAAVQLVDAGTGAHLWAETYDRTFDPDDIFALQDDLVPRIVSTVADWYGALPHSMSEAVRGRPPEELSPYEAVLRSFGYYGRITPDEHLVVRAALERAVEQAPGNADGWAMLSMMYGEEHRFDFNVLPDSLGRSLQAARRAVDAAHANNYAWLALAQAHFFRKEFGVFRDAAERAIVLNSMDGSTLEYLGHLYAFSGDWDRGCDLAESARLLNPNHPGWYWCVPLLDAFRRGDHDGTRTFALKTNWPEHYYSQALHAAAYGEIGDREAAEQKLRKALRMKPDLAETVRGEFAKWYLPELVDRLMEGLRKAGLEAD